METGAAGRPMVAPAAQMAADSIATIDEQVAAAARLVAAERTDVDPAALPGLAQEMTALGAVLAQWPQAIRPSALKALQSAFSVDTGALAGWAAVDRNDRASLLAFARSLAAAVRVSGGSIAEVANALAPFSDTLEQANSAMRSEMSSVSQRLAAEQQSAAALQRQVEAQQRRIEWYRENPFLMVLEGLTIVGLIAELTDISNAEAQASRTQGELARIEQQMAQFTAVRGPLLNLTVGVTLLSGGISNMQTGIQQIGNILNDILEEQLLAMILAAQLEQIVEDLTSADQIIREILA
jgi:hemolysin-activating ACP:hemolysin acyltransferase